MSLALLSPLGFSNVLFNGPITTKALWMRACILLAAPFFVGSLWSPARRHLEIRNPLTASILAFAGISTLAALAGVTFRHSFWGNYERMQGLFHFFHLLLLYFYLVLLGNYSRKYMFFFLRLLVGVGAFAGVYGLLETLGMRPWTPDYEFPNRVSGLFGTPVFFASFLVLPIALALFFCCRAKGRLARCVYLLICVVQLSGVVLSGTRGAIAGLVVGGVIAAALFIAKQGGNRRGYVALMLLAGMMITGTALMLGTWLLPQSYTRLTHLNNASTKSRLLAWHSALQGLKAYPVLGTGPENYYVLANRYYDPKMVIYELGRFDKPHNYLLEILTTTGLFGFTAYLGICVFSLAALWRAYNNKLLSWNEAVVLACGLIAYHVQNCFLFDMPASGMAFYVYTALLASLSMRTQPPTAQEWKVCWARESAVGFCAALSICCIVVTVGFTLKTLRTLQLGETAAAAGYVEAARASFDDVRTTSFVYDRRRLAIMYQYFASQLSAPPVSPAVYGRVLDGTIRALEDGTRDMPNDPVLWLDLAQCYNLKATSFGAAADVRSKGAIDKALALEPNSLEPLYYLAEYKILSKQLDEALEISRRTVRLVPEDPEAHWRLAIVHATMHDKGRAIHAAEDALRMGYILKSVPEFTWLINYYIDRQDYATAAKLYEQATRMRPHDFQLYTSLAATYAKLGDSEKAINAAKKANQLNPSLRDLTIHFLRSIESRKTLQ